MSRRHSVDDFLYLKWILVFVSFPLDVGPIAYRSDLLAIAELSEGLDLWLDHLFEIL